MLQQLWDFLMKPLLINLATTAKVTINGVEYTGDSISLSNAGDTLTVHNVTGNQTICTNKMPKLDIVVNGNVDHLEMAQGDLTCQQVNGDAKTSQGDINCGDVTGNVKSSQGNIKANNVGGSVKTSMGNIKYRK